MGLMSLTSDAQPYQPVTLSKDQPIHFIGVGGVGMSALAKILHLQGYSVSGSDQQTSAYLTNLQRLGCHVHPSHQAELVPVNALVVVSTAIRQNNPELVQAKKLNLKTIHRSQLLDAILRSHKVSIGVLGTHGKTTMTGMLAMILEDAGWDPTIIVGGKIQQLQTNAKACTKKPLDQGVCVAEVDESDGSMVIYQPTISIIANIELDHADQYADGLPAIMNRFRLYLKQLPRQSVVVFNLSCPNTRQLFEECQTHVTAIGVYLPALQQDIPLLESNQYALGIQAVLSEGLFDGMLYDRSGELGRVSVTIPGVHNMWNAALVAIVAHHLGVSWEAITQSLSDFKGMGRRFDVLGTTQQGALVIDDYAHHPTEVRSTIEATIKRYPNQTVVAIFQPHRFSRLKALWQDFITCFAPVTQVGVLDAFGAGELPIEGYESADLVMALEQNKPNPDIQAIRIPWPADPQTVMAGLELEWGPIGENIVLLCMGAGDITQLAHGWVVNEVTS